jgi:hypothetical protein
MTPETSVPLQIVMGDEVADFVGEVCNAQFAHPLTAIGYSVNGVITGGAVFNGYTGRNVDLSIAHNGRIWPPAFVRFFGDYIWNTLGVERVTMITRQELEPMCIRMGAKREGILRNWYPDGDAIILGLLKDEWRYDR